MGKENFNEKLTALLKTYRDFLDDTEELIPAAVRDHAWRLDHNLICQCPCANGDHPEEI